MSNNTDFRLQLKSHNNVFATREDAVTYINDYFKPDSLKSEPAIVYYGSERNPNVILAIGTGDRKVFCIDITEVKEQIALIEQSDETKVNEINELKKSINNIVSVCGLVFDENKKENQISYEPDKRDNLIGDTNTLADAVDVLSKALQKGIINSSLSVTNTKSINLALKENNEGNGKVLQAAVKISTDGDSDDLDFNNNIICLKNDGLYASSHLDYDEDKNILTFTTSGLKNGRYQDDAIRQKINLGKHTDFVATNSDLNPVKVEINTDGNVRSISSKLKLSENANNILQIQDGSLLVNGRANNIKYKDSTVANALDNLNTITDDLKYKSHIVEVDSNTIDFNIGTDPNGCTTIGGEVKTSNDASLIVSNGGLSVNLDLDVDTAKNTLTLKLGNTTKVMSLPKIDLTDVIKSVSYDKNQRTLTIVFSNGQSAVINIADLLTPYNFVSDASSPIKLTEVANPENGTSTVKADINVRYADNLIGVENGAIYVSSSEITNRIERAKAETNDTIKQVSDNLSSEIVKLQDTTTTLDNTIAANKNELTTELNTKISKVEIVKNSVSNLQYTLMVDNQPVSEINIPEDQFLQNVDYDDVSKILTFSFQTTSGIQYTKIDISDLIDQYEAGQGLKLDGNIFSAKIAVGSENYLQLTEDGIILTGVNKAINDAVAKVNLSYDVATNSLTFDNGVKSEKFALYTAQNTLVKKVDYKDGYIILTVSVDGVDSDFKVPVSDFIKDLKVDNSTSEPIQLSITKNANGEQVLSAALRVAGKESNSLVVNESGSIFVSNNSKDYVASVNSLGTTSVQEVLSYLDKKVTQLSNNSGGDTPVVPSEELDAIKERLTKQENALTTETTERTEKDAELATQLNNKVSWTPATNDPNRRTIVLGNHETLLGTNTSGSTYNLAMLSKWDVADFGSNQIHLNLNSNDRPTLNDGSEKGGEDIAYLSDIQKAINDAIQPIQKQITELVEKVDGLAPDTEGLNQLKNRVDALEQTVNNLTGDYGTYSNTY